MRPLEKSEKDRVSLNGKTISRLFNKKSETNSIMISEDRDIFDLAPHCEEKVTKVLTSQDGVLSNARPGDYIQFMKNVGGGGGHRLIVKDFKVLIEMFSLEH